MHFAPHETLPYMYKDYLSSELFNLNGKVFSKIVIVDGETSFFVKPLFVISLFRVLVQELITQICVLSYFPGHILSAGQAITLRHSSASTYYYAHYHQTTVYSRGYNLVGTKSKALSLLLTFPH